MPRGQIQIVVIGTSTYVLQCLEMRCFALGKQLESTALHNSDHSSVNRKS